MKPLAHLLSSGAAAAVGALWLRSEAYQVLVWAVAGASAGVLIDLDHMLIHIAFKGGTFQRLRRLELRALYAEMAVPPGGSFWRYITIHAAAIAAAVYAAGWLGTLGPPIRLALIAHLAIDLTNYFHWERRRYFRGRCGAPRAPSPS